MQRNPRSTAPLKLAYFKAMSNHKSLHWMCKPISPPNHRLILHFYPSCLNLLIINFFLVIKHIFTGSYTTYTYDLFPICMWIFINITYITQYT